MSGPLDLVVILILHSSSSTSEVNTTVFGHISDGALPDQGYVLLPCCRQTESRHPERWLSIEGATLPIMFQ